VVWATRLNFITLFLWPKISLAMREVIEENHEEDEDIHQAGEENDAGYPVNNAFDEEAVEVGDDEENEAEATEEEVKNNDAVSCNVAGVGGVGSTGRHGGARRSAGVGASAGAGAGAGAGGHGNGSDGDGGDIPFRRLGATVVATGGTV